MKSPRDRSRENSRRRFLGRGVQWTLAAGVCPAVAARANQCGHVEWDEEQARLVSIVEAYGAELGDSPRWI